MIPAGYMAKRVSKKPEAPGVPETVIDIFSVSSCISEDFTDEGTTLFYYEIHDQEFNGETWQEYKPEPLLPTKVDVPSQKNLEGFDVVTFWAKGSPECSPLSCNGMAKELPTNQHCLFTSFTEAEICLNSGAFRNAEPGPYRIFAVHSVNWDGNTQGTRH